MNKNHVNQKSLRFKIAILKDKLSATDYQAIKFAEGELSETEFAPIREQRRQWRAQINALEEQIKGVQNGTEINI